MGDESSNLGGGGRSLVEQVNEEWGRKLREKLPDKFKLHARPLDHFLIALGVKEIRSNEIVLGSFEDAVIEGIDIHSFLGSLCEALDITRYNPTDEGPNQALGRPFLTELNRKNPYRVEIYYEKDDAPEGALVYAFGRWVVVPSRSEDVSVRRYNGIRPHDILKISTPPRQAIIADRPDKYNFHGVEYELQEYEYRATQVRLANEYDTPPHALLFLSTKGLSGFKYYVEPGDNTILEKWGAFIPGLKESYQMR